MTANLLVGPPCYNKTIQDSATYALKPWSLYFNGWSTRYDFLVTIYVQYFYKTPGYAIKYHNFSKTLNYIIVNDSLLILSNKKYKTMGDATKKQLQEEVAVLENKIKKEN